MNNRKRLPKSVWLPVILLIYLIAMAVYYGPRLIAGGETLRFILISLVELAIIILLWYLLRRKERKEEESNKQE
jgi:membrane protein implicated in regulation of membrane protease activity